MVYYKATANVKSITNDGEDENAFPHYSVSVFTSLCVHHIYLSNTQDVMLIMWCETAAYFT